MIKYFVNKQLILNEAYNLYILTAIQTNQRVNFINLLDEIKPVSTLFPKGKIDNFYTQVKA